MLEFLDSFPVRSKYRRPQQRALRQERKVVRDSLSGQINPDEDFSAMKDMCTVSSHSCSLSLCAADSRTPPGCTGIVE